MGKAFWTYAIRYVPSQLQLYFGEFHEHDNKEEGLNDWTGVIIRTSTIPFNKIPTMYLNELLRIAMATAFYTCKSCQIERFM